MIEEYIQLLVNSGHKYSFIKSIVLQAITKYEYMLYSARIDPENNMFQPLYRDRKFEEQERKILKCINYCTWYTGEDLSEEF